MDPPYYGVFNDYSEYDFDNEMFKNVLDSLECNVIFSNSKEFIDKYELEKHYEIEEVKITDKINSKSPGSGKNRNYRNIILNKWILFLIF